MSWRFFMMVGLVAFGVLAGLLAPGIVEGAGSDSGSKPKVFRRVLPLGVDQPVVLHTNYGNVEVVETDGSNLELVVHRRRHDDLYLEIERHDGALHIKSVFGIEPPSGPPSVWDVGYELHVPRGTRFEINTGEGRVLGG